MFGRLGKRAGRREVDGGMNQAGKMGRTEDELLQWREDVDAKCHLHLVDLEREPFREGLVGGDGGGGGG